MQDQLNKFDEDGLEAGMTVIDNDNGYIVAMVGGRDYYADNQHTNHAITQRQTGSAFKAFTLATAIDQGMSPNIIINCNSPQTFDDGSYKVSNYDNHSYGYVSLARATEVSANTGYVQVAKAVGIQNVIDMCHNLGIDDEMNAYSSLTLGTKELSTLQMAEAYSTFAMGGEHRDAVAITEIQNRDGEVIYQHEDSPERVLDASVAAEINDILQGVISSGTATGAQLSVNQPFAGKTGTTEAPSDLWFCGYTPQYTMAVWTGHSGSNQRVTVNGRRARTSDLPIPIARNFFNTVLDGVEREEFPAADGQITYQDDSVWEVDGKPLSGGGSKATTPETETAVENENPSTDSGTGDGGDGGNTGTESPTSPTNPSTGEPESPTPPTSVTPPTTDSGGGNEGDGGVVE